MDVFIDFKSPAAYLALGPTLALAKRLPVEINWHPCMSRPSIIPQAQANEDRGATHRRVRAIQRQKTFLHYAGVQQITMNFRKSPGNTDFALATLETLTGDRTPFVIDAFQAYWTSAQDLNDPHTVQQLAPKSPGSLDVSSALDRAFERSQTYGVIDAPAYVVAGQLFIGREHLPWIERLLTDG